MRTKYILIGLVGIVVGVLLASVAVVLAGTNFDAPSGPTDSGSQMYTLAQVYDRANNGIEATKMTTFDEPDSGPAATMYDLNALYTLVSERSRPAKTGQTTSCATGDDGDLGKGVTWPNPRFIDDGGATGVVTDTLTGLIWLKNANCAGAMKDWATALSYSNALYDGCTNCFGTSGDCGLSDGSTAGQWRLPNVRELHSLIDFSRYGPALPSGYPFTGVQPNYYWSSTTNAGYTTYVWIVYLPDGDLHHAYTTAPLYVWPVRGGQ